MSGDVPTVEQTATFADLSAKYPNIEVWPDPESPDHDSVYF